MKKTNHTGRGSTQEKILQVAIKLFSQKGYHGTTVDEIVAKAKVNKRMVYHYFGDKEGLYRAVHLRGWTNLQKGFQKSLAEFRWDQFQAGTAEQSLILEAVKFLFDYAVENPSYHRIILWDALEGGKMTRSLWKEIRQPLHHDIAALLQAAQMHGLIPKELNINHAIITSLGMISFYFTFANSLEEMFGQDPLSPKAIVERREQVILSFKRLAGIP